MSYLSGNIIGWPGPPPLRAHSLAREPKGMKPKAMVEFRAHNKNSPLRAPPIRSVIKFDVAAAS
jgi:hypothetical protein